MTSGVDLVGQTGTVLSGIVNRVGDINGLVAAIATSAHAQADSLNQVSAAVADVDRVTQQNAAMVEESTAAARSLSQEATELAEVVQRFDTGRRASPTPRHIARKPAAAVPAPRYATAGNAALKVNNDVDWSEF